MDLINLWQEKYAAGKVRYDPDLLAVQPLVNGQDYAWGTVFYSQARESYKTQIKRKTVTFDLDLMREMQIAEFGNLNVAANPNSLFPGHLVIYPKLKSAQLTGRDLTDITTLALSQPEQTFIHNMEQSAASILDWAHFQAYPINFPIEHQPIEPLETLNSGKIGRIAGNFPTYALVAEISEVETIALWLEKILDLLAGDNNPHHKKIPCNFIWKKNRVWIIPRAENQSNLAASYFGGLEMGGIFCLPNADDFRRYLPDVLRAEIINASLACESETQKWFEKNALRLLCEMN